MVGLVAKAKRRKKVSESRLAQRTGKSTRDRQIESLIKAIKEGKFKPAPMPSLKGELKDEQYKKLRKYLKSLEKDGRKPIKRDITNWWKFNKDYKGPLGNRLSRKKGGKA